MLDQFDSCDKENIIHQLVKVQARVNVTPLVKHGMPKIHCIDSCVRPHSGCTDHEFDCCDCDNCNFILTQIMCVEIPIYFDANVDIKEGILCCETPEIKPDCKHDFKDDINNLIFTLMKNKIQF